MSVILLLNLLENGFDGVFSVNKVVSISLISRPSYLPGSGISPEKCEVSLEPVVDLVERQLSRRGLIDGLPD